MKSIKSFLRSVKRKFFGYNPYPNEKYDSFMTYWDNRKYPRFADIETTNICNAKCLCCLQGRATRPKGIMSLDDFKIVAVMLKQNNVLIRGMYTTGEPFIDPTLFEKFKFARQIGVMAKFVSLNTNVSLLTKEKFDDILKYTDNITLSFFHTGKEYEHLTGLDWHTSYENAADFIKYRDSNRPSYRIFIGVNPVAGSDLKAVEKAFRGYRYELARDAELRWAGKVITGVIDRAIMYPTFRCDGHEGVIMIKWTGDCEICSYDFFQETEFCNIFADSWKNIERKFKELWRKPSTLCARCDYWNQYWACKRAGFKKPKDQSWQRLFLEKDEPYQR